MAFIYALPNTPEHQRSLKLLEETRHGQDEDSTDLTIDLHARMSDECEKVMGYRPYLWQTYIGEAIHRRLSSILIAPMGAGKTIPFILPLLVADASAMVLILSPLKELQNDQVRIAISFWLSSLINICFKGASL